MKRVIIIIFVVALFVPSMLYGQVEKQVEVTKAFVPKLDKASKLSITPDMSDTVKMRPEIDYSITPLTLKTELATRPIKPATVTYWEFNRPSPIYIKVGGGYPSNSVADFYYSSQNPSTGYIAGYANHEGRYAKIKNDFNLDRSAMYMSNRGGVAAGKYFGRQTLEMDVNYFNYYNSRYGADDSKSNFGSKVNYGLFNIDFSYGDDFVDLSRLNFGIALYGSMFRDHSDYVINEPKARQINGGVEGVIARTFGYHKFLLNTSFEVTEGQKVVSDYSQKILKIGFHYGYDGDFVDLELGADYYRDDISSAKIANYVIPKIKLSFNMGGGAFIPYISFDGELRDNSYRSLLEENPYMAPPLFLNKSSVDYNMRLGIEGNLSHSRFSYRLFAGWSIWQNNNYWYGFLNSEDSNEESFNGTFIPYSALLEAISLNGELAFRPAKNLLMIFEAHAYMYSDDGVDLEHGEPSFTADAKIRYSIGRFAFGASAQFQSAREWSMIRGDVKTSSLAQTKFKAPSCVDVRADINFKVSGDIDVFAEVRNIANAKLYPHPYYQEYGTNFTVGVQINF